MNEEFEIVGHIEQIETIAVGNRICEITDCGRCMDRDVGANSKALRLFDFRMVQFSVEIHWYEAHGVGRKKFKIKNYID